MLDSARRRIASVQQRIIDTAFRISLFLKGFDAIIETAGGVAVLFLTRESVMRAAAFLTHGELSEDPHDLIANYLVHAAAHFSAGIGIFAAAYLASHGLVKLFLVVSLLRRKLWAYPLSFAVFGIFILYQGYEYVFTRSVWLVLLTVFDLIVLWLIWREYRYLKRDIVMRRA